MTNAPDKTPGERCQRLRGQQARTLRNSDERIVIEAYHRQVSSDRHPPVCSPDEIRAAYKPGLRIVWDEAGQREVWEITAVDQDTVTTRFTAANGSISEHAATFEQLSSHSAFPIGPTTFIEEEFETPAGQFHGTHCIVNAPKGDQHFYFSDEHPGPPIRIEGPGVARQQVERSDMPAAATL